MPEDDEQVITSLIRQLEAAGANSSASADAITADKIDILASSLLPTVKSHTRSLAYLALSKVTSNIRSGPAIGTNTDEKSSEIISQLFAKAVESRLSSVDDSTEIMSGLALLSALFQVDAPSASLIFLRDGLLDSILDASDLFESSIPLQRAIADVLAQASGSKSCRLAFGSQATLWLDSQVRKNNGDITLRASTAIALTKLSRGGTSEEDATLVSGASGEDRAEEERKKLKGEESLALLMKGLVLSSPTSDPEDTKPILDAVEGLAYMSVETTIKESLSKDSAFLKKLFSLVPSTPRKTFTSSAMSDTFPTDALKTTAALQYGIAVIISNLSAYRPQLTDEEAQVEKLRRMTKPGASAGGKLQDVVKEELKGEDDESVKKRGLRMIEAGVLQTLVNISRSDSQGVRHAVGKAFLSLVEEKGNRGKLLQAGGAKALLSIIRSSLLALQQSSEPPSSSSHAAAAPHLHALDLLPIQALAKLAITSSPAQVFGPSPTASYDALRPFSLLLLHPQSTLLQKFEALMALTNLSSVSPESATRISNLDGLLGKVEGLLLDDNEMIRRASMELLCNLIASDEIFERYSGEGEGDNIPSNGVIRSRLHIILALADVDDVSTRVAASGALAMLTNSPKAVAALFGLEKGPSRVFSVIISLIVPSSEEDEEPDGSEPDPRLVHRGIVCLRNVLVNSPASLAPTLTAESQSTGVVDVLVITLKERMDEGKSEEMIVTPAAEALKWLLNRGAKMPD
jgi:hypothetical protein